MRIMVTGAGGFIGGHLVKRLLVEGYEVIAVDIKPLRDWWQLGMNATCLNLGDIDLRDPDYTWRVFSKYKPQRVFALAADMGGMGFIKNNDAKILHNNSLININTIDAAHRSGVERYLFTSSVCVYPYDSMNGNVTLLEEHAYPALPSDEYGWEKLTSERVLQAYHRDYGMDIRIARLHNTYGPYGTWMGGREKAPAALCRKVAYSKMCGDNPITIDVWGDGQATRTFMYVDDCVEGLIRLMNSDYQEPLNLGTDELVTVDELALACCYASMWDRTVWPEGQPWHSSVSINHIDGPQGHRNRGQDNSRIREVLGWEPKITIAEGLAATYTWIEKQVQEHSS